MASSTSTSGVQPTPPEGRLLTLHQPDVHVEARRVSAAAFDLLVILVIQTWINDVFGVTRTLGEAALAPIGAFYGYVTSATTVDAPWIAVIVVTYFSVQEALFGTTWGKTLAGLRVIDSTGRTPGLTAVLVRNIVRIVDYWPLLYLTGAVSAYLSPQRQRLGDRVARTLVVRAESAVLAYTPPQDLRRRLLALVATLLLFVVGCFAFSYYLRPPLVIQGLANTHVLFWGLESNNYTLGAPRRQGDTITYPLSFRWGVAGRLCQSEITLRWHGFFGSKGGWVLDSTSLHCTVLSSSGGRGRS